MKLTSSHMPQKQKYEIWTKLTEKNKNQQLRQKEPKSSLDAVPLKAEHTENRERKERIDGGKCKTFGKVKFF
jgi:hypothetical protein